jgi:hypothetical protein
MVMMGMVQVGWGQIFSNPITDANPSTSNPYTNGQTVNANITVSGIGRGPGILGNNASNRYNSRDWSTATSIESMDYFTFTLTPNVGYEIDFVSFVYTSQASPDGPTVFAFRSSLDGFASDIGVPTAGGTTISLSSATYQNITASIEFRLYGWDANTSAGTFSVNDFTFNGFAPLPVELTFFEANSVKNNSVLTWSTATELNNDHFQVERSADGRSFDAIGKVNGAGTSYETLHYAFTDEKPLAGWNYYRLKQVDFDGQYAYSPVRAVQMEQSVAVADRLSFFPNPAGHEIVLKSQAGVSPGDRLEVFDQFGRVVLQVQVAETPDTPIDLSGLSAGHYVARLQTANGLATGTFVVNR